MTSKKIKIAHIVCTYPPYRGGMGNVAYEYTERLRARGYNVHVFTVQQNHVEEDPRYVHRVPAILQVGNAGVMPSLYYRLKGFDLVHLHYPFFGGAEPVIVRKALRGHQGLVMTYHMDAHATGVRGALFQAHHRLLFPWIASRADRLLVSSEDYFKHSKLASVSGIRDRLEVHPFGVDTQRFCPGEEHELRERHRIAYRHPILLFVGGMDRAHDFKGIPQLLKSVSKLTSRPWHLVLVGDGDLRTYYEQLADEYGLSDRVTFAGSVSNDELPRYFRLADIVCFPSTSGAEAYGLVAVEAAASGRPTIASDLPGVRMVVRDGDTGLLVPPGDVDALREAIISLLTQTELRERLGLSARLHAESTFAWEPIMDRLEQTYASVLEQESPHEYPNV